MAITFPLSPRALEVLQRVKDTMCAPGLTAKEKAAEIEYRVDRELMALSVEDISAVNAERNAADAKAHAEWAAEHLVDMLHENGLNAEMELFKADLFWKKKLITGYLVQKEWLAHSWQWAETLAQRKHHEKRQGS